jgi:hypothetical protein
MPGAQRHRLLRGYILNGSIYASTNLTNWAAIGAATQILSGLYQFTDLAATNYPIRYYRLRSL